MEREIGRLRRRTAKHRTAPPTLYPDWSAMQCTIPATIDDLNQLTKRAWGHGIVHRLSTVLSGAHSLGD